ncbi:MAG: amino acid transporter [Gammaproteobacteria bacterium RIFCSPLOWO2_12_FULL_38_14]|nr:MAG: amino acid transporter [Gammaproteobacteria bacterium RIFCSPHIGHO2_12_38_15]OGT75664.1 MAG: amino acid transporter [Gammaproteobacteria bacterium RIFCSPLOWO2_12_FULL_38_14]
MKKMLGGVFLIIGTTVGAGMLSLPLITAACGLGVTIILLLLSWSVMYVTALKLLHLCAEHPVGVNFTTLINKNMPRWIQQLFIIIYLLLLYSLMSAYTTQGASFISVLSKGNISFVPIDAFIFIIIFGTIIASFSFSDYVNRSFLSIKLIFFILAVLTMIGFFKFQYIMAFPLSFSAIIFAWPTLLPAFGFQNIVPVLYEYQNKNIAAIKKSILLGSLAVLLFYLLWTIACLAILPQQGLHSYQTIYAHGNTLNDFIDNIKEQTHSHWIKTFLSVFINVSVITSFICSGLSLFHYIKDTFKRFNISITSTTGLVLTFLPPYLFTILYPNGFILALQFASIFAVLVFVYTPIFLEKNNFYTKKNLYPIILGSLVIIAQLLNLIGLTLPYR